MELQEDTVCQERWCDCQVGGESICDHSNLCLPLHSGDHEVDDNIFNNSLTPPLPSPPNLPAENHLEKAGDYASAVVISDTPSDVLIGMNDPLWMSKTVPVWPVSATPHECSLCSKVFSTLSALHKHQLSHQQDRPHECPVCKRGFKRSDHLNVHLLTHQKRKQFRSSKPAFQKSCCDSQPLKYHLVPSPSASTFCDLSKTSPTQWKGQCADVDPLLGNLTGDTNYHSIFLSPPSPKSDTKLGGIGYTSLNSCGNYTSLASLGGSGPMSFSRSDVTKVLDPWSQGENRGDENDDEPNRPLVTCGAPQKAPIKKPEFSTTTIVGPHYGKSDVNIPVSKFQALEEILLFQPFKEEQSPGENIPVVSASSKRPTQSRPAVIFKQAKCQTKQELKRKSPLEPQPHSFSIFKGSAFSETISAPNPTPGNMDDPVLNYSDQAQSTQHISVMLPSVLASSYSCGVVQPETPSAKPPKKDSRKRARKKKVKETNLPAPPLPPSRPSMHFAPRHPRSRSLQLISPSQVAMASFSALSVVCLTSCLEEFKGKNSAGDQLDTCISEQALPPPSENSSQNLPLGEPSWTSAKEDFADQIQGKKICPEAQHLQVQKAPCAVDKISMTPLVIPVSVPVSERTQAAVGPADKESPDPGSRTISTEGKGLGSRKASKKPRNLKFRKTLFIPGPATPRSYTPRDFAGDTVGGQWWWAAGAYPSQLRSPVYLGEHLLKPSFEPPPYTPPPMLSPLRPGTGLYFSTLPPSQPCPLPPPSTYMAALDVADGISLVMDDTVVTIEPRINVGSRFQAEIPPLQNLLLFLHDEHPAQLVWAPWSDISSNTETEKRVTALLDLSCSSVLPGGGTNTELALHCLHEAHGDVLAALELLLIKEDYLSSSYSLRNYHYSGSDYWSPQEKRLFCKALMTHGKNFQLIQNMLQNKSVAQCVEYYYAMKKLRKFKQRTQGAVRKERLDTEPTVELPGGQVEYVVKHGVPQKHLTRPAGAQVLPAGHSELEYICEVCGRGFEKVKSRSAHMKTHRNKERFQVGDRLPSNYSGEAALWSGLESRSPFYLSHS